ncbi:dynein axonemal heavy chain 10-like [Lycorma delicatula]|uniref:dynein axonemal heavy chain 10-like n=1 Tax=Lycorma delicatula TaxID=130591 RepID=UPI003F51590D
MNNVDSYGTQQPIALLKLLFEKGGFYGREKDLNWMMIRDISFLAAMDKAGGGRNEVDTRFISMFSVWNMAFPSDDTVTHIYQSILEGHVKANNCNASIQLLAERIVTLTLQVYKAITKELPATPSKFHYIFNLRDLSRITAGLVQSKAAFYTSDRQFLRLWRNEITRVLFDRLISDEPFISCISFNK